MIMRIMKTTAAAILVTTLGVFGQDSPPRSAPSDPPKLETARFGNPTSTARAYQDFKFGIVKEIKKGELVLDKTSYGDDLSFKLLANTKFVHDGKVAKVDDLHVGDHVFVNVKFNKKTGDHMVDVVAWGVVGKNMKGQGVKKD